MKTRVLSAQRRGMEVNETLVRTSQRRRISFPFRASNAVLLLQVGLLVVNGLQTAKPRLHLLLPRCLFTLLLPLPLILVAANTRNIASFNHNLIGVVAAPILMNTAGRYDKVSVARSKILMHGVRLNDPCKALL
jgi:hypothetical protein